MRHSILLGLLFVFILSGIVGAVPCIDYKNDIHYVGYGGFEGPACAMVVAEFDGSNWGILAAGRHTVVRDGRNDSGAALPTGVDLTRFESTHGVETRKPTSLK